jgi:hypothetical protein
VGDLWYWNLGLQAAGPFLFNVILFVPLMFLMGLQDVKSLVCGCYLSHNANTCKIKYFKNTRDRWKF